MGLSRSRTGGVPGEPGGCRHVTLAELWLGEFFFKDTSIENDLSRII